MQYVTTEGVKGICTTGWHLPTDAEWTTLTNYLSSQTAYRCNSNSTYIAKSLASATNWYTNGVTCSPGNNQAANNATGFTGLPGGCRSDLSSTFITLGQGGIFWSSTEESSSLHRSRYLSWGQAEVSNLGWSSISWGFSVRCIRDCATQPTQADAGPDQLNYPFTNILLEGNIPTIGAGIWSIISGEGGSILDPQNPLASFLGVAGNTYTLRWTISTSCNSSFDDVVISFCLALTIANAGSDQINQSGTSTTLQGNIPAAGSGLWSIISGTGGNISAPSSPTSTFTGVAGNSYTLRWTITTACASSSDDVVISFCPTLTVANAGPDQINHSGTSTTLQGNNPGAGNGLWSIVSGTGGNISTPSSPTSTFTGLAGNAYTLRWTITTTCGSGYDEVVISFCPTLTTANAGPDQLNLTYNNPTLQGNTPAAGSGLWSIISGAGGSIANPSSPTSTFTGVAATTYVLRWTITTVCSSSYDEVTISFASGWLCGTNITDSRDGTVYPTVHIGTQCWMQRNMAYLPSVNQPADGSQTTPKYYVYGYDGTNVTLAKTNSNYSNYGVLYNWPAATSSACPSGWHLPTDAEWCTITTFIDATVNCSATTWSGTNAGGKMKETGTTHWTSPNTGATNSSGFTALGAGSRYTDGTFVLIKSTGGWWSSTAADTFNAWGRLLMYNRADVSRGSSDKSYGISVRCIKN
jgi:uncharacterized protein (TIGR02145 family)